MAIVVVTGANRGIGLELTRQLLARGDEVIAVCRNGSPALETLGAEIVSGIDVSSVEDTSRLGETLRGRHIDVLINNAGLLAQQTLGEIDAGAVESMLAQYRTNSLGPVLVTQALADDLAAGSKVIIITSRMGSVTDNTSGGSYGYRMSKAAANIAGASLAHDLEGRRVAVALLHPGYVRTDMTGQQGLVEPQESAAGLLARIDALDMTSSGTFQHANGERLPW